jgi:hypothetical protein
MGKLTVSGKVLYSDGTPACEVEIKLYDLDLGPGGKDDLIFTKTTRTDGTFSGETLEWNDREGKIRILFKDVDIPDILNLEFRVRTPNGNHKGPFLSLNTMSAPIILPFGPPKPVKKNNRELVQIIYLSKNYTGGERLLYDFIELGSGEAVRSKLENDYKMYHLIHSNNATLQKLVETLTAAGSSSTTHAVDLVVCLHGSSDKLGFYKNDPSIKDTEFLSNDVIKTELMKIPLNIRKKFRMLFSTACFGQTHLRMWNDIGFDCASGSLGVYADSEVSLLPFLNSWEHEKTFAESVKASNDADVNRIADEIAKAYYKSVGKNASQIDSTRVTGGDGLVRIYSTPKP